MIRYAGIAIALLAALNAVAHASRAHMPMGFYVHRAELIVIADTHRGGQRGYDTLLSIREVVQGDPQWAGKTVTLQARISSSADARVPTPAEGIAVLLGPGWQQSERWPVVEAYQKPQEIETLRLLVKIYQKPDERQRLMALRKVFAEGNPVCREQLFADFREMKDPDNFDLITDFYPSLDSANQRKLVDLLGQIGDLRAVPTLIRAMSSADATLSATAASRLAWTFPGAPGVTEAFQQSLDREHLARTAAEYLVIRGGSAELKPIAYPERTPWQQAERLWKSGDKKAAKALYLKIIEDKGEGDYTRRNAAGRIVRRAGPEEKKRIRMALLPLLARDAETNNFIHARQAAEILRALGHRECLAPLVGLLQWPSYSHQRSVREATMAIRELGMPARREAAEKLTDRLESAGDRRVSGENPMRLLLELVWVGTGEDFREAELVMPDRYRRSWEALGPLLPLAEQKDEGAFLLQRLQSGPPLSREVRDWVLYRLGDLRDRRAVEQLVRCVVEEPDWMLNGTASEALVKIGGPAVEAEMAKLLTHEDHNRVRRHAVDAIFKLQGNRSLATAQRMLSGEDFGLVGPACSILSQLGTPEDLKLLLPLCDYWTADRKTHHLATSAVAMIRGRHGYDINGPIDASAGESAGKGAAGEAAAEEPPTSR